MQRFVEMGWKAHGAVVCEPTSLTIMPAHKGFLWIDGTFRGRAAHGSRPEKGIDAILHAGQFLAALVDLEADLTMGEPHPLLAFPSFHAGTIEGGTAPSVYPAECRVVLERRTLPGEGAEDAFQPFADVLDSLRHTVEDLDATLEPGLFRPGTEVPLEDPLVCTLMGAMEGEGVAPDVEGMTAWVDAAFLNEAGIPAVCFGPGSIAQAHSAKEWVPVVELETGARVLTRFAEAFLAG
jgi:acetylornithine deacetylase